MRFYMKNYIFSRFNTIFKGAPMAKLIRSSKPVFPPMDIKPLLVDIEAVLREGQFRIVKNVKAFDDMVANYVVSRVQWLLIRIQAPMKRLFGSLEFQAAKLLFALTVSFRFPTA